MNKVLLFLVMCFFTMSNAMAAKPIKHAHHRHVKQTHTAVPTTHAKQVARIKGIYLSETGFDKSFKTWGNDEDINPRLLKVVCTAESSLQPKAHSKHGARGLCQIMPKTWAVLHKQIHVPAKGYNIPDHSIKAAAHYMKTLKGGWSSHYNKTERQKLILASYNAGLGNVLEAQKLCGGTTYKQIIRCLPRITGKHSKETTDYVAMVVETYSTL